MKKVVCLIPGIQPADTASQSILIFNGLYEEGYSLKVIVLNCEGTQITDSLDSGIEVFNIRQKVYFDPMAILKVKNIIKENNPDFLIMIDRYPILYAIILNRIFKLKYKNLIIIPSSIPSGLICTAQNRLIYGPFTNLLDPVVFVCSSQKKFWMEKYNIHGGKVSVILNGIDVEHFEQFCRHNDKYKCRERYGIPADASVIATDASLRLVKCHKQMFEAVKQLRNEGTDMFLIIIGDGTQEKYLKKLSEENGIADHVMIVGYVSDVRPYLMCADIYVQTAVTQTISLTAIESMAMGKALILSNAGGAPEIVDEGVNGYLCTPENTNELVTSIRNIFIKGRYLHMGEKAREKARRLFTRERMICGYVRLLKKYR